MRLLARDIEETMLANGWKRAGTGWRNGKAKIWLDEETVELFDVFHAKGHRGGWERGAYEEMTQEDVDPPIKPWDEDAQEIPDLDD